MNYSTTLSHTSSYISKLNKILIILLSFSLIMPTTTYSPAVSAYSDHPNLFVSAENSLFDNHISGPMVPEVIVREDNTQLDQAIGQPNVSINGNIFKWPRDLMVLGTHFLPTLIAQN